MHAIDLVGQKFGKLTVIERDTTRICKNGKYRAIWICKCECGGIAHVRSISLRKGHTKSCGCLCFQRMHGQNNSHYKGCGEISGTFFSQLKYRSKITGIPLNISIDELWNLFLKQNRKCALTGRELNFYLHKGVKETATASLDRIDSNKGYTIDNVQWVHKDINMIKQSYSQNEFIQLCKEVANHCKSDII
jgi:hypothetical protein